MWNRSDLKKDAKETIKRDYWKAFLVSTLTFLVIYKLPFFNYQNDFNIENEYNSGRFNDIYNFGNSFSYHFGNLYPHQFNFLMIIPMIVIALFFASLVMIAVISVQIFLGYPIAVGETRYFISASGGVENMNYLTYVFRKDRYLNSVKTMFLKNLFIFFWSLLFIIPGIIKYYEYSMVKYIVADNPKIDYKRALEISRQMTRNNKWKIFVLDLSFIGWLFLGSIAFGYGLLFVFPYIKATKAQLYLFLRNRVLSEALYKPEEFSMVLQLPDQLESNDEAENQAGNLVEAEEVMEEEPIAEETSIAEEESKPDEDE